MSEQTDLVLDILKAFHKEGLLKEIFLIGSWSQFFYKIHFNNPPEVPATRTQDIDFLVPYPNKIKRSVDVTAILEGFDFKVDFHRSTGLIKHVHPDLQLEFLAPLRSRGKEDVYKIPKLKVNAVGLRMLNLLSSNPLKVNYKGIQVMVPHPAAYSLHKYLINKRRKNPAKKVKDLEAAIGISRFLIKTKKNKEHLKEIFLNLPKGWRTDINEVLESAFPELKLYFEEK